MNILPTVDDIQCREMTFTGKLQLKSITEKRPEKFRPQQNSKLSLPLIS